MLSSPEDLLNSGILDSVAAAGLRSLGTWFDSMVNATDKAPFNTRLPLINKTLTELVSLDDLLPRISTALMSFLDTPDAATDDFVSQAAASLTDLANTDPAMAINFLDNRLFAGVLAAGDEAAADWLGYVPDSEILLFNVGFRLEKSLADETLSMFKNDNSLGVNFEAPVTIDTSLNLDFTFGYNLTQGMSVDDAFFIRLNNFTAGIDIDLNASADFNLGMGLLDASVENGTIDFTAEVAATLGNPDNDTSGIITLGEISGTSPAGLLSFAITQSSLSASLPLRADLLGTGARTTLVIEGDPLRGEAPVFHLEGTDITEFSNFSDLTPSTLLSAFDQIANLLSQIIGTDILNTRIPLVDTSVGEVLDFGRAFGDQVTSLLYNFDGTPAYQDISQLEKLRADNRRGIFNQPE